MAENISLEDLYEIKLLHLEEQLPITAIAQRIGTSEEIVHSIADREAYEWDLELSGSLRRRGDDLNYADDVLGEASLTSLNDSLNDYKKSNYTVESLFRELWDCVREENPQLPYIETIKQIEEILSYRSRGE